jgi:hypothetical protein
MIEATYTVQHLGGGGPAMPVQIFTVVGCEVLVETRLGGLGLLYGMSFGRGNI